MKNDRRIYIRACEQISSLASENLRDSREYGGRICRHRNLHNYVALTSPITSRRHQSYLSYSNTLSPLGDTLTCLSQPSAPVNSTPPLVPSLAYSLCVHITISSISNGYKSNVCLKCMHHYGQIVQTHIRFSRRLSSILPKGGDTL